MLRVEITVLLTPMRLSAPGVVVLMRRFKYRFVWSQRLMKVIDEMACGIPPGKPGPGGRDSVHVKAPLVDVPPIAPAGKFALAERNGSVNMSIP